MVSPLTTLSETAPPRPPDGGERSAASAAPASDNAANWMALAFGAELLLAAAVLGIKGITEAGIVLTLMLTARLAFPLFWLAYAGGALPTLLGARLEPLRRQGRAFGLAFAAAMTIHLSVVATLCVVVAVPAASVFAIFGAAAVCMYALALFSIARLRRALGPRGWKVLSFVAMNYVLLAFLDDFTNDFFAAGVKHALFYWPFLALALGAPALRFAAFLRARQAKLAAR